VRIERDPARVHHDGVGDVLAVLVSCRGETTAAIQCPGAEKW
jgi:hypothetical protein